VFLIAFVLVVLSTVVAAVLLPKHKPEPVEDPDDPAAGRAAADVAPAVLV
jgi:hypothetical protein